MTRPPILSYLVGNLVVLFGTGAALLYCGYRAWTAGASWWPVIGFGVLISFASSRYNSVQAYRQWKREWDAMEGCPVKPPLIAQGSIAQLGMMALLFGVVSLAAVAFGDPALRPLALAWLTLGECGFAVVIFRRLGKGRKAKPKPAKAMAVAVCLAVPSQSPDARQTYARLPDYCRRLFARAP